MSLAFSNVAGSPVSLLVASTLVQHFTGKGLVSPAVVSDPKFMVSVGLAAAAALGFAAFRRFARRRSECEIFRRNKGNE